MISINFIILASNCTKHILNTLNPKFFLVSILKKGYEQFQ